MQARAFGFGGKMRFVYGIRLWFTLSLLACTTQSSQVQVEQRLWCDADSLQLCHWQVEAGDVRAVTSWDKRELGVELVSSSTALTQTLQKMPFTPGSYGCGQKLDMVAYVQRDAELEVGIDLLADGAQEYTQVFTHLDWKPIRIAITPPLGVDQIRFGLRKMGDGQVILAQPTAYVSSDCPEAILWPSSAPMGVGCQIGEQCASHICSATRSSGRNTCGSCSDDRGCHDGKICGLTHNSEERYFTTCIARAQKPLGTSCRQNAECMSNKCAALNPLLGLDLCSSCLVDADCKENEVCGVQHTDGISQYRTCRAPASTDEPCTASNQCRSQTCCEGRCSADLRCKSAE